MGLFDFFFKEKTKHKDIHKKQAYLEKLIKKSVLLFEEENNWYDKNDCYHYFKMAYYLTPQNDLVSQEITGHRDGHNVLYGSQLVFRKYITFHELTDAIANSSLAEAKCFEGITKDNCRDFVIKKRKGELVKNEEKRLRKIYPDNDAWRAPKNIADSMGNIGCARMMLENYTDKLENMSYKEIEELYIESGIKCK